MVVVVALPMLVGAAACSSGKDQAAPGSTTTTTTSAASTTTRASTTTTTERRTTTTDGTTTTTAPRPGGATQTPSKPSRTLPPKTANVDVGPSQFALPSGNIGCYIGDGSVRCDIGERQWEPPPPPQPCELDYGHGIELDAEGTRFVCAGDTVLGSPDVLAYGDHVQHGQIRCDSDTDGVRCQHLGTGHGFHLSRAVWEAF
jgi:hypothetical protein